MVEGLVHRILAPSFVDGPGSRMAVFLQGCSLACAHCHNPETWNRCGDCGACVPGCPAGALEQAGGQVLHHPDRCQSCDRCLRACPGHSTPRCRSLTPEALEAELLPWTPYLDGVTFTGGECTLQPDFLLATIPRIQALGLTVLIDTCGETDESAFAELAAAADGFLFDIKTLGSAAHVALTGRDNDRILRNLARAAAGGKLAEVRTVVVPGHTDDPRLLQEIAILVRDLGPRVPWTVIPFRPQGVRGPLAQASPLASTRLRELCAGAREILGSSLQIQE